MAETPETKTVKAQNIIRGIVLSGWILCVVCSIMVLAIALYLMLTGTPLPAPLSEWSSIVLGFIFGTISSLVKDFIGNSD